jgi:nicotinamide riboside transporter PnuC
LLMESPYKLFGREPALWLGFVSSTIMFVSAFVIPLTPEQQGVLNAVVVAVFGLLTAWFVARDGLSSAVLGFIKAVLSLAIAFGLQLSPDKQSIVMTLATGLVAMFVRTQATAPISKEGTKVTSTAL